MVRASAGGQWTLQDESGKVWVSYNSPEYLQERHGVPAELGKNIAGVGALVANAVE